MKKIYNLWNIIINFKINVLKFFLINTTKSLFFFATYLISLSSYSQTFVSTSPENKNVILEEFTGIHCVWCPAGHLIGQQLHDANPNDVFLINIHAGGYATPNAGEPDFRTSFGAAIDGQAGVAGYPAGTVNRHQFTMTQGGGTAMSRSDWGTASTQILAQPSPVNVGVQANVDMATNVLTVHVEVYYTSFQTVSSNMLNIAVVQNNIEGPQTGGASNNPGSMLPNGNYNHNHMLRHMLTGQWGEQITTITSGSLYSNTYTWTMPTDINGVILDPTNIAVIAFVAEDQQEILSGTEVYPNVVFANSFDAYCMSASANDAICGTSTDIDVTFRNYGNQNLTSLDINYSINGGSGGTHNWTGNLAPAGTETITIQGVSFSPQGNNNISVSTSNPNGNTDQNTSNDNTSASFAQYDVAGQVQGGYVPGNISIDVTTDQWASESSWELLDDNGTVIASAALGSMTASAPQPTVTVPVSLNECYSFIFYDSYGDGICCSYGNGSYKVTDANGTTIAGGGSATSFSNFTEIADHFKITPPAPPASWDCDGQGNCNDPGTGNGAYSSYTQCMAACVSTAISNPASETLSIYPNPVKETLHIQGQFELVEIYDIFGKLTLTSTKNTINTENLSEGIYMINITINNMVITKKVTIVK